MISFLVNQLLVWSENSENVRHNFPKRMLTYLNSFFFSFIKKGAVEPADDPKKKNL